jgi:hypothetical protein
MAAGWFGEPASWTRITDTINLVFTVIFMMEFVLKLAALGRGLHPSTFQLNLSLSGHT